MLNKAFQIEMPEAYRIFVRKKIFVGLVLVVLVVLFITYSLNVGPFSISLSKMISILLGKIDEETLSHVLWNIRLPRTLAALMAGAGLGMAGAVMQNILRNPLASPFTLGVSQGAAFGAAFAIIVFGAGSIHRVGNEGVTISSPYLVVLSAFIGSLITVSFILVLSTFRGITPESLILAGVALSSFFGAATMLLQYFASDMQVAATVFWTFGDLAKARWFELQILSLVLTSSFIYFLYNSWNYNAVEWGEDVAKSLGVNIKTLILLGMMISSLVASVATAFLGIIGFVGLISPHVIRIVVGNDYRFLIPYSALFGGLLLLISDVIGRTLIAPVVLPVGIVTSFAGAPLFLYLLIKNRKAIR